MVDIKPRIKIERCPNPDVRIYHTTSEISQYTIHLFNKPLPDYCLNDLVELGVIGKLLVQEVFTIAGVDHVSIKSYELQVSKGSAFEWEEVEPGIIEALKRTFGPDAEKVDILDGYKVRGEDTEKKIPEKTPDK